MTQNLGFIQGLHDIWFPKGREQDWHNRKIEKKLKRKFESYSEAIQAIHKDKSGKELV